MPSRTSHAGCERSCHREALPIVTHRIDSGKLTRNEVREAQQALRDLAGMDNSQ